MRNPAPSVKQMECHVFKGVLGEIQFSSHRTPDIDHMTASNSDGRGLSEAPPVIFSAKSPMG